MLMKSDDDDGYCSRSSVDSPIQISKPDCVNFTECLIQTELIEETAYSENCVSDFSSSISHNKSIYINNHGNNHKPNEVSNNNFRNFQSNNVTLSTFYPRSNLSHSNKLYKTLTDIDYITKKSILRPDLNFLSQRNINSCDSISSKSFVSSRDSPNIECSYISDISTNSNITVKNDHIKLQSVILPSNRTLNKNTKINLTLYNEIIGQKSNLSSNSSLNRPIRLNNIKNSTLLYTDVHPVVDHDYCEFSTYNAEIQSGIILLSTETCQRTDKQNSRKLKSSKNISGNGYKNVPENKTKTFSVNKADKNIHLNTLDNFIAPLGRPRIVRTSKPKKLNEVEKINLKLQNGYQDDYVYYATPASSKRKNQPKIKTNEPLLDSNKTVEQISKSDYLIDDKSEKIYNMMTESDVADLVLDMLPRLQECHEILRIKTSTLPTSLLSQSCITLNEANDDLDLNLMADEISDIFSSLDETELQFLETKFTLDKKDFDSLTSLKSNIDIDPISKYYNESLSTSHFNSKKEDSTDLSKQKTKVHQSLSSSSLTEASPPLLITVKLFWNEMPGLKIDNQEYVRLIDIHKQILPAKDTGILKKRCQVMGFEFRECTDMERDFLIRYATAAQSKSKVIVSKKIATLLIEFYAGDRLRENYLKLKKEKEYTTFQKNLNLLQTSISNEKDENGLKRSARLHDKRLIKTNFTKSASRLHPKFSKNILKENIGRKSASWDRLNQRTISTRKYFKNSSDNIDRNEDLCASETVNHISKSIEHSLNDNLILESSNLSPLKFSIKLPVPKPLTDVKNSKLNSCQSLLLNDTFLNDTISSARLLNESSDNCHQNVDAPSKDNNNLLLHDKFITGKKRKLMFNNSLDKRRTLRSNSIQIDEKPLLATPNCSEGCETIVQVKIEPIDNFVEKMSIKNSEIALQPKKETSIEPKHLRSRKLISQIKSDSRIFNKLKSVKHIKKKLLSSLKIKLKSKYFKMSHINSLDTKKEMDLLSRTTRSNTLIRRPQRASSRKFDSLKF